jgi:hypothetical protein
MVLKIQNRHDFPEDLRRVLDEAAGSEWEYSSTNEESGTDGGTLVRYVIHDAGGNELKTVLETRAASGACSYAVEE